MADSGRIKYIGLFADEVAATQALSQILAGAPARCARVTPCHSGVPRPSRPIIESEGPRPRSKTVRSLNRKDQDRPIIESEGPRPSRLAPARNRSLVASGNNKNKCAAIAVGQFRV
eukprot:796098-Prorocentrum_minimum.AAC.2